MGRRERKRRETRLRIEDAATELFLEHGYDKVTLEEICEQADISRRTFFNYFASKDHVVVGTKSSFSREEKFALIGELVATEEKSFAEQVTDLLMDSRLKEAEEADASCIDPELTATVAARRAELQKNNPELAIAKLVRYEKTRARLTEIIVANFERYPQNRVAEDLCSAREEAFLIVTMVTSILWNTSNLTMLREEANPTPQIAQTAYSTLHRLYRRLPEHLDLPE